MQSLHITKTQLCGRAGIARPTLDAVLSGGDCKLSTLVSVASVLGVSVAVLVGEHSVGPAAKEAEAARAVAAEDDAIETRVARDGGETPYVRIGARPSGSVADIKLIDALAKSQQQIDRLITIIEKMHGVETA